MALSGPRRGRRTEETPRAGVSSALAHHLVVTGSEAKESTLPSVLVHAGWARGLKPGQLVDMLSRPRDGKTYGFPLEIYANAKATTPIGFMGVVWGK